MVLGNVLLLAGVQAVAGGPLLPGRLHRRRRVGDGAERRGHGLFADGGEMMTKPYAAGGNYVDRMSDYCADCR